MYNQEHMNGLTTSIGDSPINIQLYRSQWKH